VTGTDMKTT